MQSKLRTVVIVGGGFGGIKAARDLARKSPYSTKIILISNKSYFEYYPALYRVITGSSPIEVCVPLSYMIPKRVEVVLDTVNRVDLTRKEVGTIGGKSFSGDALILALGSETTYFNLPGLDTLSQGFKSIKEALALKAHLSSLFDAHNHPSQNELVSHFHVLIVGGGPSGVEVAGDLATYLRKLAHKFNVDCSLITIDLVQSASRLVPQLPVEVSRRIERQLRLLGVNIFLNRQLVSEELEQVYLKDMSMKAKTVIWTAGTRINQFFGTIAGLTFSEKKRVVVGPYLNAVGFDGVFIIGDAAETPYSGLAQTAVYDGGYVAEYLCRHFTGRNVRPYRAKKNAFAIPVGDNWGVFVYHSFHMYGLLAYFIRHAIDFFYFSQILSPKNFFGLFFQGYKYRKIFQEKLDQKS